MMKTLFERQHASLDYFFSHLDIATSEKILEKIRQCKGCIILCGVGKSGHIAQKIAATMVSTGTRAVFLCPLNALHGDLGFVSSNDVFILFSKSGETQELLDLLPFIKKRGAFTIGIISQAQSRLAKAVDMTMILPVDQELCPLNLAPTTSTAVQLLFGDALAIQLMEDRKFSERDFAANHPAGFLGRKITMRVFDLMLKQEAIPLCKMDDLLIDTLHELTAKKCGCLLVCDENRKLCGIFTDGDLRRAIESNGPGALQMTLSQLMTKTPVTISQEMLVSKAAEQMKAIQVLPVTDNEKVVGLLRMHDVVQVGLWSVR
ncbi:MAG TPA: KpsF/GutQ family sugar-phosphate isomerase [Chlamydiales bacterium]|nr:KpsF/GutQ family sugar-phosphate isomerase [Chlamydiales bacterium]